jgi:hypothetical protein
MTEIARLHKNPDRLYGQFKAREAAALAASWRRCFTAARRQKAA